MAASFFYAYLYRATAAIQYLLSKNNICDLVFFTA